MRTTLSLLLAYLFGDKVNPIYIHWSVCPIWYGFIFLLEVEEIKDQINKLLL